MEEAEVVGVCGCCYGTEDGACVAAGGGEDVGLWDGGCGGDASEETSVG